MLKKYITLDQFRQAITEESTQKSKKISLSFFPKINNPPRILLTYEEAIENGINPSKSSYIKHNGINFILDISDKSGNLRKPPGLIKSFIMFIKRRKIRSSKELEKKN